MNIRIEEKLILESLYKNDRSLSTTELKSSTGIDTDAIGYSVREKLAPEGLVDFSYEEVNGTEVRVHTLTATGESEIQQGLIGDVFAEDSGDPERVALEARIDELEEELERVKNKQQANKQLLDTLRSRVDKAAEVIQKHDVRLNGIRWAVEDTVGVDVVEYVNRVKNSE
jgi:hypothetical protein